MKPICLLLLIMSFTISACSQKKGAVKKNAAADTDIKVGGRCEDCEAIYESPVPFNELNATDTLPDFSEKGPRMEVSGIIYQQDGKTPAADVIMYFYHTDQKGVYPKKGAEKGMEKKHGYLRGWIKTDAQGRYNFYTLRPASYPNSTNPAHIHAIIKEKGKTEYWIDDFLFADDPFLPKQESTDRKPRGGNGVLSPVEKDGLLRASRAIILGQHVEGYPAANTDNISSGLAIGDNCPAFDPLHLSGPDKGKNTCPMCKYGYGQGIMVWFNHANLSQRNSFVQTMETEMKQRGEKKLRVFMVYMNPFYKENDEEGLRILRQKLRDWCEEQNLQKVSLVWIPSPLDEESAKLFAINPKAKNTVFVYKKRKVAAKWVNIEYSEENSKKILEQL